MKNKHLIVVQDSSPIPSETPKQLKQEPYFAPVLIAIAFLMFWLGYKLHKSQQNKKLTSYKSVIDSKLTSHKSITDNLIPLNIPDFNALESQIKELALLSWTTLESFHYSPFAMDSNSVSNIKNLDQFVEKLLHHARKTVPGFNVPYLTPHIVVENIQTAAGLFQVDEEGWVTIKVSEKFLQDTLAAQAILAHEVCHYVLENSGIRKNDFLLNERYTDMCMFVCGFGHIFTSGYKREIAQSEYRMGHRLGYLTDAEYERANSYVMQLRQELGSNAFDSELDLLKKELLGLVHEKTTCDRLISYERNLQPNASEIGLYRNAVDRVKRDRGIY
jgi:hypothetical protein